MAMRQKTAQAVQTENEEAKRGAGATGARDWSRRETGTTDTDAGLIPEERVEDFLDRLYAPLVPSVPYAVRRQVQREMREHLLAIAEAYEELGSGPEAAVEEAIARFGAPEQVSAEWLRAWRGAPSGVESALPAAVAALKTFSQALVAGFAVLHINDRFVSMLPGEHLPGVALVLVLPMAAGMLVGVRHRRGALGTFYALSAVTLLLSLLAWIDHENGMVAQLPLLLAFWTPIGCASAALTGWMRRLGRRAARGLPAS